MAVGCGTAMEEVSLRHHYLFAVREPNFMTEWSKQAELLPARHRKYPPVVQIQPLNDRSYLAILFKDGGLLYAAFLICASTSDLAIVLAVCP